ncbi:hypothetical protein BKA64DRAFT_714046 [Cadophora sp. MPI-SDFR-AT-0126]|nr:hypothetical protein BKA64DRAFT_714046 [Leotiomycetes sp. MPI-SDFR-AT-0126]
MTFDDMCNGLYYALASYGRFGGPSSTLRLSGLSRINAFRARRARNNDRDRIYSLLGLADDAMELIPDYKLSIQDVYIQGAKHVASHGDLSMVTFLTGRSPGDSLLPSSASNWTKSLENVPRQSRFEKSMAYILVMSMKGVLIDTVGICGDVMNVGKKSRFDVPAQWEVILLQRFGYDHAQNDRADANGKHPISDVLDHWH